VLLAKVLLALYLLTNMWTTPHQKANEASSGLGCIQSKHINALYLDLLDRFALIHVSEDAGQNGGVITTS
jgi:hypothetical protein